MAFLSLKVHNSWKIKKSLEKMEVKYHYVSILLIKTIQDIFFVYLNNININIYSYFNGKIYNDKIFNILIDL